MRLIEARSLNEKEYISFVEFYGELPKYAILSHTWDGMQEVSFQDCNSAAAKSKTGYDKVRKTCELALRDGIEYVWVDTCCIDKTSSAELTEAINSMFSWYQKADICYVYLADKIEASSLEGCRWFYRGWTLQELIAPSSMKFFNHSWSQIGNKDSLMGELSAITSIDVAILSHKAPLSSACIAKRLSWAACRKTTRVEDMAYCLLGICQINMPMLYGEGQAAFNRLQQEIIRSTYDLSLLAWMPVEATDAEFCGFLAQSVKDFAFCSKMYPTANSFLDEGEMSITNKGLRLHAPGNILVHSGGRWRYALQLGCMLPGYTEDFLAIPMRKIGPNTFIRARALGGPNGSNNGAELYSMCLEPVQHKGSDPRTITLLTTLPSRGVLAPFTQVRSFNIVSSSRFTLVQLELPPGIRRSSTPIKFWDAEDCGFFGSHSSFQNWGAISFDYAIFVCFWCRRGTDWTFQGTLLEPDSKGADDLWKQLFIFAEQFGYKQPTVQDLLERVQQRKETSIQAGSSQISFRVRRADDHNLCSGPRWKVAIEEETLK